ncbi:MAG: DUF308 domain-containing protein [Pseudobutyrivibrio sp.]|nr:DUF308 domain-containing protein [Pseudobutyrivibrio sp.]
MKEKIKNLRLNVTFSAVVSVIIGVLLLLYPSESLMTIGKLMGVIICIAGASVIVSQIFEFEMNIMGIIVGGILAVIGVWIFLNSAAVLSIIPIAIGVILVIHGVQDLGMAIEGVNLKISYPWAAFLIAALNILLGLICIGNAFGLVSFATRIIGIMLIYDGITSMFVVHRVRRASTVVIDSTIIHEEDI